VPVYNRGFYLRFDNLRDACEGWSLLQNRQFDVSYVDNYDLALAKSQDTASIDEFEGQIMVIFAVQPAAIGNDIESESAPVLNQTVIVWLHDVVELAMSTFGTVRTFVHTKTENEFFTYRVEFFSAECATRAAASLRKDGMWGTSLDVGVRVYHPTLMLTFTQTLWRWATCNAANWQGPRAPNSPHRHLPRVDDRGRLTEFRHAPQIDMSGARRHPADAHNRVRRERILDGTDVRTTIMLRNIPNKVDWVSHFFCLCQQC
jgi:hypothetical protein